ncbi:MAG: hypothetical protein EA361_10055 [Bacteroidetes bacterium]|nr:MAG: hypothetical protein EA361_10055 [Bacteroidota bacterium]
MTIESKPLVRFTIISAILFAITLGFYHYAPEAMISDNLLYIVPFFYLVHIVSRIVNHRIETKDSAPSKIFYLVSSGIKLMFYLVVLILYGIFNREDVAPFFLSFLVFYLIFTFLDVKHLVSEMSK